MKIKSKSYMSFTIMLVLFGLFMGIEAVKPAAGEPENIVTSGDWQYIDYGAEITVRCYMGNSTDVVIPEAIDGKLVTKLTCMPNRGLLNVLSPMFLYHESVKSVTIPDSVTSIGPIVFDGCINLESIIIPDGVTEIGETAFQRCTSLTYIKIPSRVASIGDFAFSGCANLKDFYFDSSKPPVVGEFAFMNVNEGARAIVPKRAMEYGKEGSLWNGLVVTYNHDKGSSGSSGCNALNYLSLVFVILIPIFTKPYPIAEM